MYPILNITIPQEKRKEINAKILHIIDNNITNTLTKEIIFNTFTGEGALHGLNYKDFNNYYEFSNAKKEIELAQFFTPLHLSKFIADFLKPSHDELIADLTAGHGSLINFLPNKLNVYANEYELRAFKVLRYLFSECNLSNEDIRAYNPSTLFDIVLGNPPYNIKLDVNGNIYNSQYYYMLKAHELLKPAGILVLIVPKAFLSDDFTESGYIKEINRLFNHIQTFILPFDTFKSAGANIETKIMIFQKKSEYISENPYNTTTFEILTNFTESEAERIYNNYIKPLYEQKEKVRGKLLLEANRQQNDDKEFQFKVKKLLFDIKRTKKTAHLYGKAEAYVMQYYTQKQPEGMKYEEWQKKRITKNKVIAYLKRILKNQHNSERDEIRLVKTKYGLKMKAYSRKASIQLSKMDIVKEMSFNNMILNNNYPFEDQTYKKLFERKKKEYEKQSKLFSEIKHNSELSKWLDNFTLYNQKTNKIIKLRDIQKKDLNKVLQKDYAILNWQQGSGKTEAAITWMKYIQEYKKPRNVFIVSTAISINMTWVERLTNYGIPFVKIESLKDIQSLKHGDNALITFDMLIKYKKHLQKYAKMQSQKVALIVDESHRISNYNSKRTRATIAVFRRVKYKLLMTGTVTRNNINELYPQLELLYNNSINMLCTCPTIQREDRKTKQLTTIPNEYYMKPFPAFNQSLFKACFSPAKTTVFGVNKETQDIYNSGSLKTLIEKTIITRKFTEIAGDNRYNIITHRIDQNENEKEVYKKIMNEFYEMIPRYFGSTGNYKKDAMLRIIRQLQLMIKATSIPHKLKEYSGFQEPNKYLDIQNLIQKHNEKVIVGTVFIDAAAYYYNKLRRFFNNRSVFLIQGNVSFEKRQEIIEEFEKTKNGILVTTQQSLSESVNIPTCNMVIIESLQWNIPSLEQFYFRTIRLDSEDKTNVYIVTYNNTIEQNILALLMSKERINEFIKTLEYKEQAEIFNEFDIDLDIFNSIISKELDENGNIRLTWGNQKVV